MTNESRGVFISLEGDEFTGKTSIAKILVEALTRHNIDALYTREPGGSVNAEKIREKLKEGKPEGMSDKRWSIQEARTYYIARGHSYSDVIDPFLEGNPSRVLITDRSHDSTMVYQGEIGAGNCSMSALEKMHATYVGDRGPDRTFYLRIDDETYLERWQRDQSRGTRTDAITRYDNNDVDQHRRIRGGYEVLVEKEPERFFVVDSRQSPTEVFSMVWNSTIDYLLSRNVINMDTLENMRNDLEGILEIESFQIYESMCMEP